MPKSPACTGAPVIKPPFASAISYPAARETTGLNTELPSSEPGTAQISYTIEAGDLPVLSMQFPYLFAPVIFARCKNTSGAARTVSYHILKNGTSVATGSGTNMGTAANYASFQGCLPAASAPVIGDVITVKLWANGAGVYLYEHALMSDIMRPLAGTSPIVYNTAITVEASNFTPSFLAAAAVTERYYYYAIFNTTVESGYTTAATTTGFTIFKIHPTYGLFVHYNGDLVSSSFVLTGGTSGASGYTHKRPTSISYYPLDIKI